jgi:hypothetical protein
MRQRATRHALGFATACSLVCVLVPSIWSAGWAEAADKQITCSLPPEARETNRYFPLRPGSQWEYRRTRTVAGSAGQATVPPSSYSVTHRVDRVESVDGTSHAFVEYEWRGGGTPQRGTLRYEVRSGATGDAEVYCLDPTLGLSFVAQVIPNLYRQLGYDDGGPPYFYLTGDLHPGESWTMYSLCGRGGSKLRFDRRVVGPESVVVPAGSFACLKVVGSTSAAGGGRQFSLTVETWYAPGVGLVKERAKTAMGTTVRGAPTVQLESTDDTELVQYTRGAAE